MVLLDLIWLIVTFIVVKLSHIYASKSINFVF